MNKEISANPIGTARDYGTHIQAFQSLMRFRITNILLVSSLYDQYVFEEDGRLYELIRHEYQGLNLSHSPELTRVSSGREAIEIVQNDRRFDLIITTLHVEDMHALVLARKVKATNPDIPVVLLGYDNRELSELMRRYDTTNIDGVFIWQGDFRILIGLIKSIEDKKNVENDTRMVGVQSIIVVEDNIQFYSSFLPLMYTEILKQSQRLISEGINLSHKYLRMRARPKILLCRTYEEALDYYNKYEEYILGIVSDVDFLRQGESDSQAGIRLAQKVKDDHYDIPILLHSNESSNKEKAFEIGASFILKNSPTLLHELREFIANNFGFGDFIFRLGDGLEVARAHDLVTLEARLKEVPDESLVFHAERNHYSNWLKARTEFWLAHKLRPHKVTDFPSISALRQHLISSLREYRKSLQRGTITDFKKEAFDPTNDLARIGGGSLGGKARGLSFVNNLINYNNIYQKYKGVQIAVPPGIILGTEVFDEFLDDNNLRNYALNATNDEKILDRFMSAEKFPASVRDQLADFLQLVRTPLAVRSSSLLEDSQYHPFAGVYETYMVPNNHENLYVRLNQLISAIKHVYASTFFQRTKDYIKVTSYRLEEEKMAVIVQKMVGTSHGDRFYPDIAGVAKSHNFYPIPPQKAADGLAAVALGLGKIIVEGGTSIKFSPKHPQHFPQFPSPQDTLNNAQTEFWGLSLEERNDPSPDAYINAIHKYQLDAAEKDGTLHRVCSTYSPENEAVYPGLSRSGMRLVTFAPLLKYKLFPLPEILNDLLSIGSVGMGTAVEIEFAVKMSTGQRKPIEFGILQMRPLVLNREIDELDVETHDPEDIICSSDSVLGNGVIDEVADIVLVDINKFDRARSREVAQEVNQLNSKLSAASRPYLLIGCGRWGTLDPWLGIPVTWEQISGARAIVEVGLKDINVEPSQGSHFFQNITAFMVGYFTVSSRKKSNFMDWDWLLKQPAKTTLKFTRHLHFEKPLIIRMNGQKNRGIILKPSDNSKAQ